MINCWVGIFFLKKKKSEVPFAQKYLRGIFILARKLKFLILGDSKLIEVKGL